MQFIHEDDVGRALLLCVVAAGPPGAYNIAGDGVAHRRRRRPRVRRPAAARARRRRRSWPARAVARLPFLPPVGRVGRGGRAARSIMDTARAKRRARLAAALHRPGGAAGHPARPGRQEPDRPQNAGRPYRRGRLSFNLATMLHESALAHPDKPMLRIGPLTLTLRRGRRARPGGSPRACAASGCSPATPWPSSCPTCRSSCSAYFGALKAGLTVVPLNPLLKAPEVGYHLRDSGARLLITFDGFAEEAAKGAPPPAGTCRCRRRPRPARRRRTRRALRRAVADEALGDVEPRDADDTAVIIYTSGTTGKPKGAELTHFQLFMAATVAAETFDYRDDDVSLAVLPLFHVFGLSSVMNTAVRVGRHDGAGPPVRGPARCSTRSSSTGSPCSAGCRRCSSRCCTPTRAAATCPRCGSASPAARRSPARCCAGSRPRIPARRSSRATGCRRPARWPPSTAAWTSAGCSAIGKRLWGIEVRVVDRPRTGRCRPGRRHVGEIVIRGHNVMKGYRGRPEATAEAMRGGWFHTGDLGYARRGRLLLHRRPQEGPGHPRRLQRLPARGRGGAARAPGRARGRRRRQAGRPARRGGGRLRRASGPGRAPRRTRSSRSARSGWPPTSTRARSTCRRPAQGPERQGAQDGAARPLSVRPRDRRAPPGSRRPDEPGRRTPARREHPAPRRADRPRPTWCNGAMSGSLAPGRPGAGT